LRSRLRRERRRGGGDVPPLHVYGKLGLDGGLSCWRSPRQGLLKHWHRFGYHTGAEGPMILFLVVLLVVLWLLGMVTTTMLGGWLHILLVVAIIFLLIRVIRGQPV
jgi:hypothetical protein